MTEGILTIISLIIGYYLGLQRYEKDTKTIKKKIGKAKAIIVRGSNKITKGSSGAIYRPDAKTINHWKNKDEGEEAVTDLLDSIPELKNAKNKMSNNYK